MPTKTVNCPGCAVPHVVTIGSVPKGGWQEQTCAKCGVIFQYSSHAKSTVTKLKRSVVDR
jgi:transposase-like protein